MPRPGGLGWVRLTCENASLSCFCPKGTVCVTLPTARTGPREEVVFGPKHRKPQMKSEVEVENFCGHPGGS